MQKYLVIWKFPNNKDIQRIHVPESEVRNFILGLMGSENDMQLTQLRVKQIGNKGN